MKRSRSQSVRAVGGVVIALALPLFASSTSWASPIDQQRDRVAYYINKLDQFEEQAAIHAENLSVAIAELEQLEADLADAEVEVAAQESKVAETQRSLSDTVVRDFVGADPSSIGPLFSDASTINDNIRREQFAAAALNSGSVTSDDLNRELNDLTAMRTELAQARAATEAKRDQVEREMKAAEAKAAEYRDLQAEAEAELGQMIEEQRRREAEAAERRRQAERQAAAAAAAAANQQSGRSSGGNSQSGGGGNSQSGNSQGGGGGGNSQSGNASSGNSNSSGGGGNSNPSIPPASSSGQRAVNAAMTQIGVAYKYATANPGSSFDCSGLTSWAWSQAGVRLTRQSRAQYAETSRVPASEAQPGDLLFFYSPISHVAMYIGNGQMIHAPNSGSYVHTRAVNWGSVVGVGRPG